MPYLFSESLKFGSHIGIIEFSPAALNTFWKHRQTQLWSREAGGQLFCKSKNENQIFINKATEPHLLDRRGRFFFWPNRLSEQREINQLFNQGLHYIGDWHTHPQDVPSPSTEDIAKMQDIFRSSDHGLQAMILVVIGRALFPKGISCSLVFQSHIQELCCSSVIPTN